MSKIIYFDNAATSFPKPECVKTELIRCVRSYLGNPGRSSHKLSVRAAEEIYSAREQIANLLGIDTPECIVFTYNATHALNMAIKSYATENCHILTSDFEHNSVIRPLERLKETLGISYSCFSAEGDIIADLEAKTQENTRGMICSIASNVTGNELPLKILSDYAKEKGLFLIIDASQAIGHINIDVSETPCDALCAPGHKALFGIQGCGFAYYKDPVRKNTLIEGGSGTDSASPYMPELLPEGYEAGTPGTPAIVTLGRGVEFIKEIGINEINKKLLLLTERAKEVLWDIETVRIYKSGVGILSFNIGELPSSYVSSLLDKNGICVRGGLHCAPSIHRKLGTLNQGAVRLSFSYFNSIKEIDVFYKAIRDISKTI